MASLSWRCFHCDDVFTDRRLAAAHFGANEDAQPACQIKAGGEQGLLEALRRSEKDAADAWAAISAESTDAARAYHAQRTRHHDQLIAVEQAGYERGLADAQAHPEDLGLVAADPESSLIEQPLEVVAWRWRHRFNPEWKLQPGPFHVPRGSGPLSDYTVEPLTPAKTAEARIRELEALLHRSNQTAIRALNRADLIEVQAAHRAAKGADPDLTSGAYVLMPAAMTPEMEARWREDFAAQCRRRRGHTRDAGGYRRDRHPQSAEAYAYSGLVRLAQGKDFKAAPTEEMVWDACQELANQCESLFGDRVWPESEDDDGHRDTTDGRHGYVKLIDTDDREELMAAMRFALRVALNRRVP